MIEYPIEYHNPTVVNFDGTPTIPTKQPFYDQCPKSSKGNKMKKTQKNESVINLTKEEKSYSAISKSYSFPAEQDLAKFAVTTLVNKYGSDIRNVFDITSDASQSTIKTDVNQSTVVYRDLIANLNINGEKAIISSVYISQSDCQIVNIAAPSKDILSAVEEEYNKILEYNNFFQGKSLRFSANGVVFIECPDLTLKEAVLPDNVIEEYKINVLDFLTQEKYHSITKKRALLLYGPPGSGKTTSVKALFSLLRKDKITCMYLTDDTFKRYSLEMVFDFINKYLSPSLIAFEDVDLIGEDRRSRHGGIIGSLLSVLNGVEDYKKPIAIIGTTNRVDILDDAVTRPCRFDRKLFIDYPTTEALRIMFKNITGKTAPSSIKQSDDEKNKMTGAHIKEICNTAEMLAIRNGGDILKHVPEAVKTIKESFYLATPSAGFAIHNDDGDGVFPEEVAKESAPYGDGLFAE